MTLYSRDTPSEVPRPSCVATCADVWRPVIVHGSLPGQQLPGVNIRVRTLPRPGGLHQLAINSHRVYTFSGDRRPGDIKGNLIVTGTPDSRIHMWRPVTVPLNVADSLHPARRGVGNSHSTPLTGGNPTSCGSSSPTGLADRNPCTRRRRSPPEEPLGMDDRAGQTSRRRPVPARRWMVAVLAGGSVCGRGGRSARRRTGRLPGQRHPHQPHRRLDHRKRRSQPPAEPGRPYPAGRRLDHSERVEVHVHSVGGRVTVRGRCSPGPASCSRTTTSSRPTWASPM